MEIFVVHHIHLNKIHYFYIIYINRIILIINYNYYCLIIIYFIFKKNNIFILFYFILFYFIIFLIIYFIINIKLFFFTYKDFKFGNCAN